MFYHLLLVLNGVFTYFFIDWLDDKFRNVESNEILSEIIKNCGSDITSNGA